MSRYECDLHCHTTRSDGNDTPLELIENALYSKMKVIAITDHDIEPPEFINVEDKKVNITEYAAQKGLEIVLGYEYSCDTYVDDVHILGYRQKWNSPLVKEEVERAKKSKAKAYEELCYVLTKYGMPIDYDKEILTFQDENGVIKKRTPEEVQRKHIFEQMAKKGYAPTWQDAKILVRDNPNLNVKRKKIDAFDAIDLIKQTGGTAVLAHPFLIDEVVTYPDGKSMTRAEYISGLINHGLDGIEVRYPYSKTSYKGSNTDLEIEKYLRNEYSDRVRIFTGGSDYHADAKKNIKNPRTLGEKGLSYAEFIKIRGFLI